MKNYQIPYGKTSLTFHLPSDIQVDKIIASEPKGAASPLTEVARALENTVGNRLEDFRNAKTAAIAVNDKTRPVPHDQLLPPLLEELEKLGIRPKDVHLIIATGTHNPTPPDEFIRTLPQWVIDRYDVTSHNCDDSAGLTSLGKTSKGTPISINRLFMACDLRIAVGNIEPHHFMGFSGGAKSAAIGLAGRETITTNHAMLSNPNAITGHYEDNPMRMDVEEIGQRMGLHFCLNVILNLKKQIVHVLAGSPEDVMRAGMPLSRQICQVRTAKNYDLVIASAGGHPKDINFYQSQKALTHASLIVKQGGTILLAAACPEGIGSQAYLRWMEGISTQDAVFEKFAHDGFQIGPHKAFQVARIASKARILLVSELPEDLVESILLISVPSLEAGIHMGLERLSFVPKIAIMPYAVNTVPQI